MKWRRQKQKDESTPSLEENRINALMHIGAKLSSEREDRGFDLYDMVLKTKIPSRVLQAIETADIQKLPEPVYTQGFIRIYGEALGLNGFELANSYPVGINQVSLKPTWKGGSGKLRPVHLYLFYVGLILFSVTGLSQFLGVTEMQAKMNEKESAQASNVDSSPSLRRSQVKSAIASTNGKQGSNQDVQVGLTFKDSSWVRIDVDGKTQFEGVLPQGTQRTWTANNRLTVRAGNAGGVLVSVNQNQAKPLGKPGKEDVLTIAANTRS